MSGLSIYSQIIHLCAALMLLLSFAMLAQRRFTNLVNLFLLQGLVLTISTAAVSFDSGHHELLISAWITLILKVLILPWILHRLIRKLHLKWETETPVNIPTTMILGIILVIIAFNVAQPIAQLSGEINRAAIGIALACILLSFLMIITRHKAVPQVIAFLAMENGLFLAATSASYGMPMIVELGIALDVLIGVIILGIFFFQMRESFQSLDIRTVEESRIIKEEKEEKKS